MTEVKTISTEKLQQRLEQDNSLHLWNVLTDGYFTGEMIPGSRRVPLDTTSADASKPTSEDNAHDTKLSSPSNNSTAGDSASPTKRRKPTRK